MFDADTAYIDDVIAVLRGDPLEDIPNSGEANAFGAVADDLDERGRMSLASDALVDLALQDFALSFDVDGDDRPLGLADIGCHEWAD